MRLRRCIAVLLTAAVSILGLTGCAENQIPDLTDEEMQQIGEFVAITMMKYDAGHRSRLMDLSAIEDRDDVYGATSPTPEPEESVGMAPVDDTPIVNSAGAEAETEPSYSMEEVMALPEGVNVTFLGEEICDSYPGDSDFFDVSAGEGKKLLVLHFSIENTSEQEQKVDLLSSETVYRVTVNGEYSRRSLTTLLLDDMSTYQGILSAGESVETVLLIEVKEEMAGTVAAISLDLKNEEKIHTVQLMAETDQ